MILDEEIVTQVSSTLSGYRSYKSNGHFIELRTDRSVIDPDLDLLKDLEIVLGASFVTMLPEYKGSRVWVANQVLLFRLND